MQPQKQISVQITSGSDQISTGTVFLQVWEKKDRIPRSFKALGITWGLALVSVLIPLLHFFLVPLLLMGGPIVCYWVFHQQQIILGGKGICPDCKKEFKIVRARVRWPLSDICNHCHAQVRIERDPLEKLPITQLKL